MFSIIGSVLVLVCVIAGYMAGYLMEKGMPGVLLQPVELVTYGGAGIGTIPAVNPRYVLKRFLSGVLSVVEGSPFTKQPHLETLKMMFDLFSKSRR